MSPYLAPYLARPSSGFTGGFSSLIQCLQMWKYLVGCLLVTGCSWWVFTHSDQAICHRWYSLFAWPEGVTVWALFLTLMAIAEQASEARKSGEQAKEAVKATKESLDLMVRKERARIFVEALPVLSLKMWPVTSALYIRMKIFNIGSTPAVDISGHYKAVATDGKEIPAEQADSILSFPQVIGAGGEAEGNLQINRAFSDPRPLHLPGVFYIHVFGRIEYGITISNQRPHTTFQYLLEMNHIRGDGTVVPRGEWTRIGAPDRNQNI
jgi:hypothetical protein